MNVKSLEELAAVPDEMVGSVEELDLASTNLMPALELGKMVGLTMVTLEWSTIGLLTLPESTWFLWIRQCHAPSLESLRAHPGLKSIEIKNSFVEDLDALATVPLLGNLGVRGCPLSTHSYNVVLPQLEARGVDVQKSPRLEWEVARRLVDAGVQAIYSKGSVRTRPRGPHVKISIEELHRLLDREDFSEQLLWAYEAPVDPAEQAAKEARRQETKALVAAHEQRQSFDWAANTTTGTVKEARRWFRRGSFYDDDWLDGVRGLLSRFPSVTYRKLSDEAVAHEETSSGVTFPKWYRRLVKRFDGVWSPSFSFHFAPTVEGWGLCGERDPDLIWLYQRQARVGDETIKDLITMGYFPIADDTITALLIHLDETDTRVYRADTSIMLSTDFSEADIIPTFHHIPHMFEHIAAIEGPDSELVEATSGRKRS